MHAKVRGFTLLEIIVVVVVLGIGAATLTMGLRTAIQQSADPVVVRQAISIAQAMMDEIMSKSYDPVAGSPGSWTAARTAANVLTLTRN